VAKPLRLHREIPAPLLFIQPTQQQIHLAVVLPVKMRQWQLATNTLAQSHDSSRHPQLLL
jgi:hypothetical protein